MRISQTLVVPGRVTSMIITPRNLSSKRKGQLPCQMLVLPQTNDMALHSVIEGKVFEESEIILGSDPTAGALAHVALLSEEGSQGSSSRVERGVGRPV